MERRGADGINEADESTTDGDGRGEVGRIGWVA